jgi:type I restriction enzyme, S subunit
MSECSAGGSSAGLKSSSTISPSGLPRGWSVKPLKAIYIVQGGTTPRTDDPQNWDGGLTWITPADLSKLPTLYISESSRTVTAKGIASSGLTLFPPRSIVLSTRAPIGSVAITSVSACTNQGCKTLVPKKGDSSEFFAYALGSYKEDLNSHGRGTTFLELSGDALGAYRVAVPPRADQYAIASFLDLETAKIDHLIQKQEHLIQLLQEKRQAVISHAVTRGLEAGVQMKDSGVDWLGGVPSHWTRSRIKYSLHKLIDTEHKTAPFYDDGQYLVVRTSNVKNGNLVLNDAKYTDHEGFTEWTKRGRARPDDIIFTREAPAGEACLVPAGLDLCLGQRTVLMRINQSRLIPRFCLWSLYAGLASEFVANLSQGSTVSHFNMSDIKNIPLMLPPVSEQDKIISFVSSETLKIDCLISKANQSIELMRERRSALISAAVTGKIDIREAA